MVKDLKPFLSLYIGTYVRITTKEARFDAVLAGVYFDRWHSSSKRHELTVQVAFGDDVYHFYKLDQMQLLLRPLSDMTEEEAREYFSVCSLKPGDYIGSGPDWIPISARSTHWLISKGFDLFGLIEAGLAIDKTKEGSHG